MSFFKKKWLNELTLGGGFSIVNRHRSIIHIDDNHFVGLLPNDEDVTQNKKYTYYGYFM
jgi:hypothetical protein